MINTNGIKQRLLQDQKGAAMMEFALVVGPLMLILLGTIDLGYKGYTDTLIKSKLHEIARAASTGEMTADEIELAAENGLKAILLKNAEVTITTKSYYDFTNIGKPEKITVDNNGNGEIDPGDCYIDSNENDEFDTDHGQEGTGGPDDIVSYEITVESPRLFPLPELFGADKKMKITNSTAIRNQPYGAKADIVTTCVSDLD